MTIRHAWGLAVLCVCAALAATGCGKKDAAAPASGESQGDAVKRRFLSIGTAPPGGAFFVVGGAIAEVMQSAAADLKWQVSAESTKGTQENIRRLDAGEIDFGVANASITYFAIRGEEGWEKAYPMRTVMTLAPNIAFFLAPRSSGVQTIADLKGRRVVVGPAGAGFEYFVKPILAAHGVTFEDFSPLYNSQSAAVDMLADGSAAAAMLGGAVPTPSIAQACAGQDIVFIPYNAAAMDSLSRQYPFFWTATVPGGTYRGQTEDFACMNVGSMHLIAAEKTDDDLVYTFTKLLYEQREELVRKHPVGRSIQPANVVRDTGTPFHAGAIRFYRELGIWPDAAEGG